MGNGWEFSMHGPGMNNEFYCDGSRREARVNVKSKKTHSEKR